LETAVLAARFQRLKRDSEHILVLITMATAGTPEKELTIHCRCTSAGRRQNYRSKTRMPDRGPD
jgi:hypothetical protein